MQLLSSLTGASRNALPHPSALSILIAGYQRNPHSLSSASEAPTHAGSVATHPAHLQALAVIVLNNLRYQHEWTDLCIHTVSPLRPSEPQAELGSGSQSPQPLPRPLVSGIPPQRLYMHPDDQLALIAADRRAKEHSSEGITEGSPGEEAWITRLRSPRREWVLPTHLREKWSLRRFAEVFDAIGAEPPAHDGLGDEDEKKGADDEGKAESAESGSKETLKRVLLATVDDDSTIVYYIVHDGVVKPRQN